MVVSTLRFLSLLFAALALVPAGAHALELPNKIGLPRDDYLTAQQLYRGWAQVGFFVGGAVLSTLALAVAVRRERRAFRLTLLALACLVGTQVVFWTFTFPANRATENWTVLPDDWQQLRAQWEHSHAASAALNLLALAALSLSVLGRARPAGAASATAAAGRARARS
jgi:hypothetical protein